MDVVTYALAKKMASSVASGITEIETNGTTIRFKTTSGDWFSVTLNSINEVSVSANGHLIVKLSDGTQIDCGALPVGTMDSSLSTTSENGVQNKVITNALNGKQNTLVQGSGITIDTTDPSHPQISANIDYTNLINKPTKLSDFTNDENFITNTANNLSNYYLKTETYTQSEVNDLVSQLASLSVEIVETLPTSDISTTTIYLINVSDTTNYAQWMYINNAWANIGSTSVDLTNYYTKTQTDTLLADKVDKVSGKGLSTNDFTNAYKSMLDNYSVDSTLDSTSTNPIQNGTVTDALNTKQPKTLSSPITIGGTSQTTVEGVLGGLNSLCGTKLTMVTSLPLTPSNQETVLYIGSSSGDLRCGGIYQYQVSEWVMISNVSSFTFNSDEFAVDSTTNEVSLKPSYADIPTFLPNNVSSSNKLATTSDMTSLLKNKMSCYTWGTDKTLKAVFYEITDRGILPDVNDAVGKRLIARYGNVLINRITQVNGVKNLYWDDTLVLSCPWSDDTTKLTDVLEIFVGTTAWQKLVTDEIVPSDASASNKLVAHQTPYGSFTLNNNSGSQKWYKLGTYTSGNNTARLDFVSARVDGQMFESSVRISGVGTNSNYVSWIGEKGCEVSTIDIKVDTNRNLYVKMNSYSAVEIRVYGVFTLDIVEQSSEPSGTQIVLEKLVTESDLDATVIKGKHYHGYINISTVTIGISELNIHQYCTFEVTIRALYAASGSVTNTKYVYNASDIATPSKAYTIYNATGYNPTITFANDGNKLTSITITADGQLNTIDVDVSF